MLSPIDSLVCICTWEGKDWCNIILSIESYESGWSRCWLSQKGAPTRPMAPMGICFIFPWYLHLEIEPLKNRALLSVASGIAARQHVGPVSPASALRNRTQRSWHRFLRAKVEKALPHRLARSIFCRCRCHCVLWFFV